MSKVPVVQAAQYISGGGVYGAWIAQYPFVEPGKTGSAIEIAPTRAELIDLVDAVALTEGWTDYQLVFHTQVPENLTGGTKA